MSISSSPSSSSSFSCDPDHYLVTEEVRKRLSVSKRSTQKFDMNTFNPTKLNEVEGKEEYKVNISNTFAALESLDGKLDVKRSRGKY
jgi:hypothetical protein